MKLQPANGFYLKFKKSLNVYNLHKNYIRLWYIPRTGDVIKGSPMTRRTYLTTRRISNKHIYIMLTLRGI